MVEKKSAKRKTFVTREDLINRLSEIARARGHSLYETVNELIELAITAEDLGLTLKRIVEERHMTETARKSGFALGLENLWYEMADISYDTKKRQALKSWFDNGVWFAKRYTTSNNVDALGAFSTDLKLFTWNAPEFRIEKSKNNVAVRVASPIYSEPYTYLFASFLECAFCAFGYKITSSEIKNGIIRLDGIKEAAIF